VSNNNENSENLECQESLPAEEQTPNPIGAGNGTANNATVKVEENN